MFAARRVGGYLARCIFTFRPDRYESLNLCLKCKKMVTQECMIVLCDICAISLQPQTYLSNKRASGITYSKEMHVLHCITFFPVF